MTNEQVITLLQAIVHERERLINETTKHKKLRESERAMVISKYRTDQLALSRAIGALKQLKEG